MAKDTELILLSKKLDNGLHVTIYDKCKRIAWDRYLVKISCVVEGKFAEPDCAALLHAEHLPSFQEKYPEGKISILFDKERNFIDEGVKDAVLQDLVGQCEVNFDYMATGRFAENLLSKTVDEFILEFQVRQEMGLVADPQEVDEPDDFSGCFK
jgi:hypothetical protein